MTAPDNEQQFLPTEPQDLPSPRDEIPAQVSTAPFPENTQLGNMAGSTALRTLLSWSAPGRPFEKKTKQYFLNILVIVLLIEIILFLFSQYILMVLVIALVFLAYALGTVAPHDFHFKITTEGIMVEDHFYLWEELYDFYFRRQNNQDILIVGTKAWVPGELTVVLGDIHKEQVRDILLPYLPYREFVKPTFMEKSGTWLEHNFPLDKPHQPPVSQP